MDKSKSCQSQVPLKVFENKKMAERLSGTKAGSEICSEMWTSVNEWKKIDP